MGTTSYRAWHVSVRPVSVEQSVWEPHSHCRIARLQTGAPGPQSPSPAHSHLPEPVLQTFPPRAGVQDVLDVHGFWQAPRSASQRDGLPHTFTCSFEPSFLTSNVLNIGVLRKDVHWVVFVARKAQ